MRSIKSEFINKFIASIQSNTIHRISCLLFLRWSYSNS